MTAVYDLRRVSPAYFLQELENPRKPRRPEGIESIIPDNLRSIITVKATPAAHTAPKLLLTKIDTLEPRFEQPKYVFIYLQSKKDGKIVLELPLRCEEDKPLTVGIHYDPAELAEQEKRPTACRVPVKPAVNLILTPHLSADGKTVRLERWLERTKPKPELIGLSDLTVSVGQRASLELGDALPTSFEDLSVITSPDSANFSTAYSALKQHLAQQESGSQLAQVQEELPIFAETRVQVTLGDQVVESLILAHQKDALVEFFFFSPLLLLSEHRLWIVPHFSADEKTAQLEYFLVAKQKQRDFLTPLGTQTVAVGVNTKMVFHAPLVFAEKQEFFIRIKRTNPDDF